MAYVNKDTSALVGYSKSISAATGQTDPGAIDEIEDMMRMNLSGLDHLDRRAFDRLARESAEACIAMGAIRACEWAAELAA